MIYKIKHKLRSTKKQNQVTELQIANNCLPNANCLLPIAYFLLQITHCKLQIAYCKLPIANCLLPIAFCVLTLSSCTNKDEHKHIPANKTSDLDGLTKPANQIVISDVKTISAIEKSVSPIINATGVISYDPRLINNISARYGGRIEKLYVRFNFENVSKGQRIMDIYSPEILTAQQNLIYLLINSSNDIELINSSKQKLQLLGLTENQLKQIESSKKVINPLPVYSTYSGHIHDIGTNNGIFSSNGITTGMSAGMSSATNSTVQQQIENIPSSQTSELNIKEGMYIQNGQALFAVYNTDKVWAVLNIFPQDASQVKIGEKISILSETNPGNIINATINYLEPIIGQNAATIKARVYLHNSANLQLKIGTIITAKIYTKTLKALWLPRNAIVNLGQSQVVFVKIADHFIAKNIQTGIVSDSLVQIISGIQAKDELAENAQFMVDSESFIKTEGLGNKQ